MTMAATEPLINNFVDQTVREELIRQNTTDRDEKQIDNNKTNDITLSHKEIDIHVGEASTFQSSNNCTNDGINVNSSETEKLLSKEITCTDEKSSNSSSPRQSKSKGNMIISVEISHQQVPDSETLVEVKESRSANIIEVDNSITTLESNSAGIELPTPFKIATCHELSHKRLESSTSDVDQSEKTVCSIDQDTDTCDLFQTARADSPNSQSNVEIFKSVTATIHSSQATFISADDVLGSIEEVPSSPNSLQESAKDTESVRQASNRQVGFSEPDDEKEKLNEKNPEGEGPSDADISIMLSEELAYMQMLAPVCLYPAQVHQYCPPGLEALLDCGQLVIHKDNLRHNKVHNEKALRKMEVIDITKKVIFYVEEETPPLARHSFLFKVYDREKQEVMQIYNPTSNTCFGCGASWHFWRKCHFQTLIFAPLGQVVGFIKRSHTYFVQEYLIMNSQEDVLLVMRGGPDDLEIYSPDLNDELGRLAVHHWHGVMHEVRRSRQDYGITFPIDLDVRVKAVLLGAVFSLDWMYSTKGGKLR